MQFLVGYDFFSSKGLEYTTQKGTTFEPLGRITVVEASGALAS